MSLDSCQLLSFSQERLRMLGKIISIPSALTLKKLSLHQFCFTQRNQKEMRKGKEDGTYNRVFNLRASFWSVEILVLCCPDNGCNCVSYAVVRSLCFSPGLFIFSSLYGSEASEIIHAFPQRIYGEQQSHPQVTGGVWLGKALLVTGAALGASSGEPAPSQGTVGHRVLEKTFCPGLGTSETAAA